MRNGFIGVLLAIGLFTAPGVAPAESNENDVEGSKDHPAVKRYPGSYIMGEYLEKEFEGADFAVSASRCEHAEGRYYFANYMYPAKSSCTQVMRNFESALKAARATLHTGTTMPEACNNWGINGSNLERWLTAVGTGPKGGKTWIFIGCVEGAVDAPAGPIMVVDVAPMAQKVEIDADALAGEIEKTGHVAVYGITFATGQADISPDSAKVLAEIGNLMARRPDWRLRIEGHTDNVGNAKSNQELSSQRAQSVKAWLGARQGVKAARLETQGFGDTKPVSDNRTDEGRARNRRVELVKL